jgi:hypothetical protein
MNRSNEMKLGIAHGSRKCTTLAVGGDSETDLAHKLAIIYVRTRISMADSSPDCTRKYEVDCEI